MKKTQIPKSRRIVFSAGTILLVIGLIVFLSAFFMIPLMGMRKMSNSLNWFFIPLTGFIMVGLGQLLRQYGRLGAAGSGLILDTEQEREDTEPINRLRGGQINDVLEEVNLAKHLGSDQAQTVIKVRCLHCRYLNDEADKFCGNCGKEL